MDRYLLSQAAKGRPSEMKIHVVQREGTRYFSRFSDLSERDRLVVELRIEHRNGGTISIDLTEALIGEYSKHPEIGKVSVPGPVAEIVSLQPIKPLVMKRSKTVSPIDRADPQKADILSKVREAQLRAVEEKKQKQADQAAARAERLAAAREAKAKKQRAESRGQRAKTQKAAIKKIGKALAKEERSRPKSSPAPKPKPAAAKSNAPAKPAARSTRARP